MTTKVLDKTPTIGKDQTFAVLVKRADGEWGLLTSVSPRDFDSGDFDKATARAFRSVQRKADRWRETEMLTRQVSVAVVELNVDGSWTLKEVL